MTQLFVTILQALAILIMTANSSPTITNAQRVQITDLTTTVMALIQSQNVSTPVAIAPIYTPIPVPIPTMVVPPPSVVPQATSTVIGNLTEQQANNLLTGVSESSTPQKVGFETLCTYGNISFASDTVSFDWQFPEVALTDAVLTLNGNTYDVPITSTGAGGTGNGRFYDEARLTLTDSAANLKAGKYYEYSVRVDTATNYATELSGIQLPQ